MDFRHIFEKVLLREHWNAPRLQQDVKKRKKKTKVQSKRKKPIAQKLTVPETEYILKWRFFYYKLIGDNDNFFFKHATTPRRYQKDKN